MVTGETLETKAGFIVHVLLLQKQQKYTTEGLQQVYQSSPVWAQEKRGEKADFLLSKDLEPTSSTSSDVWVSDFSVMLGGFVADQTFSGTWLPVTGLITLSADRYLERSAHDGVIHSHGGAPLHITTLRSICRLLSLAGAPALCFHLNLLYFTFGRQFQHFYLIY